MAESLGRAVEVDQFQDAHHQQGDGGRQDEQQADDPGEDGNRFIFPVQDIEARDNQPDFKGNADQGENETEEALDKLDQILKEVRDNAVKQETE